MTHQYYSFWNILKPVFTAEKSCDYVALSPRIDSKINRAIMNVKIPGSITSVNGKQGMGNTFTAEYILSGLDFKQFEVLNCLMSPQNTLESILSRLAGYFNPKIDQPTNLESSLLLWSEILDELEEESRFLVLRLLWPHNPVFETTLTALFDQLCDIQSYSNPRISILVENGPKDLVSDFTKRRMAYSWYTLDLEPINYSSFKSFVEERTSRASLPKGIFNDEHIAKIHALSCGAIKPATQLLESCLMMMAAYQSQDMTEEIFRESTEQHTKKTKVLLSKKFQPVFPEGVTLGQNIDSAAYKVSLKSQVNEILDASYNLNKKAVASKKTKDNLLRSRISPASIRMDEILDLKD